ncbi:MAG: hypothetical protein KDC54_19050, partial [Lewinella sp.]|nr:hypothetical protein [Lewinella sp.]
MKNALILLVGPLLWSSVLFAQSPVTLSNPSDCGLGLPLRDATCPENSYFSEPDSFLIQVNSAPGTILGQDVVLKEVRLIV